MYVCCCWYVEVLVYIGGEGFVYVVKWGDDVFGFGGFGVVDDWDVGGLWSLCGYWLWFGGDVGGVCDGGGIGCWGVGCWNVGFGGVGC